MDPKTCGFRGIKSTVLKKIKWLAAFPNCLYHIENTCKQTGIIKSVFYKWKVSDKAFFDAYEKIYKNAVMKGMIVEKKQRKAFEDDDEKKEQWLTLYCDDKMSPKEVCEELSVTRYRLGIWKRDDLEFLKKYKELVSMRKKNVGFAVNEKGRGFESARKARTKLRKERQKKWLEIFKLTRFNIKEACEAVGILRTTYYVWKTKYPEFKEAYDNAVEEKKDFIEDSLMKNIQNGDSSCIIFAAKTQLKDRGYVEKQEIEHSGNFGVMVAPGRIEDAHDWAMKATKQQRELKEKSMETDYIHELEE